MRRFELAFAGALVGLLLAGPAPAQTTHAGRTDNPHGVTKAQVGLGNVENLTVNLSATSDPTVNDDVNTGNYDVGSRWVNVTTDKEFVCVDNADGAAVWVETSGGGSGGDFTERLVVVKGDDTDTANGTALLDAMAAITATATNRFLVKLEAGTYDLGSSQLTMKQYVDLEGSGEGVTTVIADGTGSNTTATIIGAADSEVRSLRIQARNNGAFAIGFTSGVASSLRRVTIEFDPPTGGSAGYGAHLRNVVEHRLEDVTLRQLSTSSAPTEGLRATSSPNVVMRNCDVQVQSPGNGTARGVSGTFQSLQMISSRVEVTCPSFCDLRGVFLSTLGQVPSVIQNSFVRVTSQWEERAVMIESTSSPTYPVLIQGCNLETGGAIQNSFFGGTGAALILNSITKARVVGSRLHAPGSDGGTGIWENTSTSITTLEVVGSAVYGETNSLVMDAFSSWRIGSSQLAGGVVTGGGTPTCYTTYDEVFTGAQTGCP